MGYQFESFLDIGVGEVALEVQVENVVAELGFGGAGFDFGEVDFGGGEVLEDCEEASWGVFAEVEGDGGFRDVGGRVGGVLVCAGRGV